MAKKFKSDAKSQPVKRTAHLILAIDQGTTGTTVSLIDFKGQALARVNHEYRQIYPKPGWVEHNPEDIWKSVIASIAACLKKARAAAASIAAIGITNQRETVVAWERKTGKALHNAIVWQDRRTAEDCDKWKRDGMAETIRETTGLVIDPYFSASKMRWMLQNISGLEAKCRSGAAVFGTIDSFLLYRLTGRDERAMHATDVSNASRTMLMNLKTGKWEQSLCDFFSIPRQALAEIGDSSGEFGRTRGLSFLPDGIPISGIAGDQQAALFGQACFAVGESKCTFGTGSFLLLNTGHKQILSNSGLLTTAAWRLRGESQITYALEGGAFICGAAVQFLRDQLQFIKQSNEIEKLAASCKDSGGVEFVPALTGLGAPYWDPHARGLICGLTRGTTRAQIARATLEAMALQNSDILLAMQKDLGHELKGVKVDGGAAANDLLMQLQADYLGVEVHRPKSVATTSLGACYLAALGVGVFKDLESIKKVYKTAKSFRPKIAGVERETRRKAWQLAVRRAQVRE